MPNFVCNRKTESRLWHSSPHTNFAAGLSVSNNATIRSVQAAFFDPQPSSLECEGFNVYVGWLGDKGARKQISRCPSTLFFSGLPESRTRFVK